MADKQTSEWIEHDGKGMPVERNVRVNVKFRDGMISHTRYRAFAWDHDGGLDSQWRHDYSQNSDIIAYRVVKP